MKNWRDKIITPRVGVAGIVESPDRKQILVIDRIYRPFGYAMPGGFVEVGENMTQTVIREVKEETGIEVDEVIGILNLFSDPIFDPRMHVVAPHVVMRTKEFKEPEGMDDAKDAFWMEYGSNDLYDKFNNYSQLTLDDYRDWRKNERELPKLR